MLDTSAYHTTIGVDIAKNVFQVYSENDGGEFQNIQVKRDHFLSKFENRERCLIGMEACAGSQNLARELQARGHDVILMHPKHVKPYVRGQKNDRNDAKGIHTAMLNEVRQVAVKDPHTRDIDLLMTMRTKLIKDKTKGVNHVRGILAEYGIVMGRSVAIFTKEVGKCICQLEEQGGASAAIIMQLRLSVEDVCKIAERVKEIELEIKKLAQQTKHYERFLTAPGVGPITAAVMCVMLVNPALFKNGRSFAAYIGLTPMSFGSGGKNVVYSIPKHRANKEVRALLVQCAHSITRSVHRSPWVQKILTTKPKKVAVIAIVNRLARQLWAMASKAEDWKNMVSLAVTNK